MDIPKCALGTWSWGPGVNGGKMVFGNSPTVEILSETYKTALKNNLLLFDTAAVYGNGTSEKILGEFIKDNKDIILSTKYLPQKSNEEKLISSLEGSLQRLGRESVDIFWLHQPEKVAENMGTLAKLVKDGKIKNVGLSNGNLDDIKLADEVLKKHGLHLYGVQNHFSLIYRNSEKSGIFEWCKENNTKFFAYMVLEQGALTGVKKLPAFSMRGLVYQSKLKKLEPVILKLSEIGEKHGLNTAETAMSYALSKGTVPIIGVNKPYQVEQLSKAIEVNLSSEEVELLEKTADETGISIKASWEKSM